MPCRREWIGLTAFAGCLVAAAQEPVPPGADERLPLSNLAPARLVPNLCVLKYRISTSSSECQAFFDQGLGYYYSYVWMEAARSFETATRYDPECAMAWWGLSRALESWNKSNSRKPLEKAQELLPRASHREQLLILARLQEKGLIPGIAPENRKKRATQTIDELLSLYPDDEEAWFARAKLADSAVGAVPFYHALLRVNPLHPGAHHELVHFYENSQRPALGWVHAEKYMESSPGLPHAFHMQAHLAMRLGRWEKTTDRSAYAIELERAYHKEMNVRPSEDWQYYHHLETLLLALIHDGRYREARALRTEVPPNNQRFDKLWIRLHLAERDWAEAQPLIDRLRRTDKVEASYYAALLHLKKGEAERAAAEVEVLREAQQKKKSDSALQLKLWETQGLLLCQTGNAEVGTRLLFRAVEKTKDDYRHHAWGNGAYYMEAWGTGALHGHLLTVAEEAFLEALAHDRGSVRGALGMQVVCERQGRIEEAQRFADLARRCWRRADPGQLERELACLRGERLATETSLSAPLR
ncbi:MAG: hypothetical protein NZ700_13490 [Gemmataceae bacterium]|nr:hypothetical protein [Gemmataceae bacterium]MDW8265332.1 hypothetical protein [Gemmataceae bacterium]